MIKLEDGFRQSVRIGGIFFYDQFVSSISLAQLLQ